jgi:hypothetical protein
MKLYFDRFEADLNPDAQEPTTKEYETHMNARSQYNPQSQQLSEGREKDYKFSMLLNIPELDKYYLKRNLTEQIKRKVWTSIKKS